jgi:hypothetical protein
MSKARPGNFSANIPTIDDQIMIDNVNYPFR